MKFIRVYILADGAEPKPPLGPILGQLGVNSTVFCNEFNESTGEIALFEENVGFLLAVDLQVLDNRTVKFFIRKPPISVLLKLLNSIEIGNSNYFFRKGFVMNVYEFLRLVLFKLDNKQQFKQYAFVCKGTARSLGIRLIK